MHNTARLVRVDTRVHSAVHHGEAKAGGRAKTKGSVATNITNINVHNRAGMYKLGLLWMKMLHNQPLLHGDKKYGSHPLEKRWMSTMSTRLVQPQSRHP